MPDVFGTWDVCGVSDCVKDVCRVFVCVNDVFFISGRVE